VVVVVEQHKSGDPAGIGQRPVDRRRAGGVVGHRRQLAGVGLLIDSADHGARSPTWLAAVYG
jgi:hypothetical protein